VILLNIDRILSVEEKGELRRLERPVENPVEEAAAVSGR
jgi:hypothetical protein